MNTLSLINDISGIFLAIILSFLFTSLSFIRYYRRKLRRVYQDCNRAIGEQKDIAWRSQMNPHFIHNCLNSINAFIHQQDKQSAANYLTCFSQLMRKVLEHSEETKITLARELDALRDYIKLELLRFGREIEVLITVDDKLDPEKIYVPPLYIQPFLENALIHGLLPKQSDGSVRIFLEQRANLLYCSITDDGIGRPATSLPEKLQPLKRSLGIAITRKRIALFNEAQDISRAIHISDILNDSGEGTGTKVEIQLALIERF